MLLGFKDGLGRGLAAEPVRLLVRDSRSRHMSIGCTSAGWSFGTSGNGSCPACNYSVLKEYCRRQNELTVQSHLPVDKLLNAAE